uniref:transposase n=1 Tax=Gemmata massiliana TaxID=1210884 RepID=UPI0021BC7A73|nr:transposase [Gemmata massiliana]
MTSSHIACRLCHWFSALTAPLDARSGALRACLFLGAILARGRRTVTSWIRAAGLGAEFRPCYTTAAASGKRADRIAARLAYEVVKPLVAGRNRLVLALDDTPTARYGPHVRGPGFTTTRRRERPAARSSTGTFGSFSGCWSRTRCGARSPCPCWLASTSERRTWVRSARSTDRRSRPRWSWPWSW